MRDETRPCITQRTVLELQWSDCPQEVIDEVREIWKDRARNLINDNSYMSIEEDWDEEFGEYMPALRDYLRSNGITNCLVHWWW